MSNSLYQITDPNALETIKKAMIEISNSMTREGAEKDLINEIATNVCKEFNLNRKAFKRAAKAFHKQNFREEKELNELFETLYTSTTGEEVDA